MSDSPNSDPSPTPPAYARRWIKITAAAVDADNLRVTGLELTHCEIGHVYGDAILSAHVPDSDYLAAKCVPAVVALRDKMLARAADLMTERRVFRVYHLYSSGNAKQRYFDDMADRWKESDFEAWCAREDGPDEVQYVAVVLEVYNLPEAMRPEPTAVEEEE